MLKIKANQSVNTRLTESWSKFGNQQWKFKDNWGSQTVLSVQPPEASLKQLTVTCGNILRKKSRLKKLNPFLFEL